jgi:hypothetical protein
LEERCAFAMPIYPIRSMRLVMAKLEEPGVGNATNSNDNPSEITRRPVYVFVSRSTRYPMFEVVKELFA